MKKNFIFYLPGGGIRELQGKSPWVQIPYSFSELGYSTTIITGECKICDYSKLNFVKTFEVNDRMRAIYEPFLALPKIFKYKEGGVVMVATVGKYLFTTLPMLLIYKLIEKVTHKKKFYFILKADWSFDYGSLGVISKWLINLLMGVSTHAFDLVSLETYCGKERAKSIPLVKQDRVTRILLRTPNWRQYCLIRFHAS